MRRSTVSALKLFGSGSTYAIDSSIFDFSGSTVTLASIDAALDSVSTARSTFGAVENRLTDTLTNLSTYQENLSAAESSIKDTDMASEMANFTKLQVLQQAGTAMLAQANTSQQTVLRLLQGS